MSKNNENKLVPKLRFPEFLKDKEWIGDELGELSSFFKGKGLAKSDISPEGINPCVHYGELFTKYTEVINEIRSYTNISEGFKSEANDVLMPTSDVTPNGLAKASCIKLDNIILGGDILVIRPKPMIYGEFLSRFIRYREREVLKLVSGTTVFHLYGSSFEKFRLIYPSIDEQKKIAACLLSLDEVISAESQKLDILKDHKKGILQNMLPQVGETIPKFRFKEFEENSEWIETSLTQVADYENGKAHEQDIADDGEFIVVNSKFISQDGEVKKFTNTAFCPATKGDVLMVLSDIPNGKAIAKCFLVEEDNRYTVNQRICRITPRNLNSKILYYLLNRNPYFLAFDDGVKQTNLRKEDVLNCPLLIPEEPKEQEKIADTLSSVDDLIKAQNQKLEALKLHKKGLLQGLFPSINNEE